MIIRKLVWMALAFAVASVGACSERNTPSRLERFNHMPTSEGSGYDDDLQTLYSGETFQCRKAVDFTPADSSAATGAFDAFEQFVRQGDAIPDFWMKDASRNRRDQLLEKAVKAGSWKAEYLSAVQSFRFASDDIERQRAAQRLRKLVERGIPLAAYTYATYLGEEPDQQLWLWSEAIDRGSPDAMETVGGNIVARSKSVQLRSMGKAMLECAVAQGNRNAYVSLGKAANMEGHWVDAYRLWEKGANNGCSGCLEELLHDEYVIHFVHGDPGRATTSPREQLLEKMKKFYADHQDPFLISAPAPTLPADMAIHVSDAELVGILQAQETLEKL